MSAGDWGTTASSLPARPTSVSAISLASDVWAMLAATDRPVVLYGMGNGADKILDVFASRGIEAADFFASDEFVRGQLFHGKTVLTYEQVCEKYRDFIIVVAFGSSRPEVLARIDWLDREREVYIPDVPVAGGEIFDLSYFERHRRELQTVYDLLADEQSKQTLMDVLLYRLTGKLAFLQGHTVTPDDVFGTKGILSAASYRESADLGAYNGDSIRELAGYAPELARVTALEPDARNYRKLCEYANTAPFAVQAHHAAAWSETGERAFTTGGNRNSTLVTADGIKTGAKIITVHTARLDSLYTGRCDYIKYDVEGAEYDALLGSAATIAREHPELLVSLYHRSEDLFRLPLLVREMGYERLFLRRYAYVPAWDLNLLAK